MDGCVCCGEIIPEGRQICWRCENSNDYSSVLNKIKNKCSFKCSLCEKSLEEICNVITEA